MKKFLCGFLSGAIIFSMLGAFAAATYVANPLSYKVLVNGEEFVSDPPALEVNGRTYLPLRAMGDALGVPVYWNEELRQAEVGITSENTVAEKTLKGYKTYSETEHIIDFGDYSGFEPIEKRYVDSDTTTYVYDHDAIDYVVDYMLLMKEMDYWFTESEDSSYLLSTYYGVDFNGSNRPGLIVQFGQPDTSSLKMYVMITIVNVE